MKKCHLNHIINLLVFIGVAINSPIIYASTKAKNAHDIETVANSIFNELIENWDLKKNRPNLIIQHNIPYPRARSLLNGNIEISSEAIKFCLQRGKSNAQHLLAFILSHELAHQYNDDMWQNRISTAKHTDPSRHFFSTSLRSKQIQIQNDEIKADRYAITNMIISGFNPLIIMDDKSFFSDWYNETNKINCGVKSNLTSNQKCDEFDARNNNVRQMLEYIVSQSTLFKMGMQNLVIGDYDAAREFLTVFANDFPSSTIYSNIGLSYLFESQKLIKQHFPDDIRARLFLPSYIAEMEEIDHVNALKTIANKNQPRSSQSDNSNITALIDKKLSMANHYFELSHQQNKTKQILFFKIITFLMQKKFSLANGFLVDEYQRQYGKDSQVLILLALNAAYQGNILDSQKLFQQISSSLPTAPQQLKMIASLNLALLRGETINISLFYSTTISSVTANESIDNNPENLVPVAKNTGHFNLNNIGGLRINNIVSRTIIENSARFPLWFKDQRYFVYLTSDDNVYVTTSNHRLIAAWSKMFTKENNWEGKVLTEFGKPERMMWSKNKSYQIYDTHKFVLTANNHEIEWFVFE